MANFDPLTQIISTGGVKTDTVWINNTDWSDNLGWSDVDNNQDQNNGNGNFDGYLYVDNKQDKMIKAMKLLSACIRHISNKAYIPYPNELEEAEKILRELQTTCFFVDPDLEENIKADLKEVIEKEEKIVLDEDLFDI